jgi:hypothetical protein
MNNIKFILTGAYVVICLVTLSWTSSANFPPKKKRLPKDPVATHNMLVVGEKTIYLSHLPMFQEKNSPVMPHRYQAILEVGFDKQGSNAGSDYAKDRLGHQSTKIFTINPESFVLTSLVSSGSQSVPLHQFKGDIYRGHLEKLQKGETKILSGVNVTVQRVVYFQQFDPLAKRSSQLEYLLFGNGGELFLTHLIVAAPDFDQVLAVTVTGRSFNDEELAKGIKVAFAKTTNSPATRLKEGKQAEGSLSMANASSPQKIQVKVNREFYFEEGELRLPPKFDTTPEEKKSGFQ